MNVKQQQQIGKQSKPETLWAYADMTFKNYQRFVGDRNRFAVEYMDLLFVSNYKGGNGFIIGSADEVNIKLKAHHKLLKSINDTFPNACLRDLNDDDISQLSEIMNVAFDTCENESIGGFGVSYCSTLYHFVLPDLIPIVDRRVLIGLEIVKNPDQIHKYDNQVDNIRQYYKPLLKELNRQLKYTSKTLREIDKQYFIKPIPEALTLKNRKALKSTSL